MERLSVLYDLSTAYLSCRDVDSLLRTLAVQLGPRLKARAVFVWLLSDQGEALHCRARWVESGERFTPSSQPVSEGLLVEMLSAPEATLLNGKDLDPEALAHLPENDRARITSALYAAIPESSGIAGVIEVLNKRDGDFTAEDAVLLEEAVALTRRALDKLATLEKDQASSLTTIERLTSLYDISRIFNSTLELEELLPIVAGKIREIINAQACNIWLLDTESSDIYFAQQVGDDPTTPEDGRMPIGEGLVGQVAQQGEPRLIADVASEPLVVERQQLAPDFKLGSIICTPLMKGEEILGVAEAVNKLNGEPFDDDDLFLLSSVGEQAAIALHNANLLEAERKVHELDALLAISKEITSTLDLEHVLTTVVHQASSVLPFDRCVVGLFDRSHFVLGAVSGEVTVPQTSEMDHLRGLLAQVANQEEAVSADHGEEGWKTSPESADFDKSGLMHYLEEHGYNGFYALPLRDEQGAVGVLALLSGEAEFLSANNLELLSILASQTTVAIRNARLYQQVPLMNLWQPFLHQKQKLQAMPHALWVEYLSKAAVAILALTIIPWKLRVAADAKVVPAERRLVSAQVQGVIRRITIHEGSRVRAGEVLALLDDSDNRLQADRAQTDLAMARRDLDAAESSGDMAMAGQARLRMEIAQDELNLYEQKVNEARLLAPIDGIVVTPKVEEKTGQLLKMGDAFCELVDEDHMAVEMNVPETEETLIRPPATVAIKLNSFPTQTLEGVVQRVGAQTTSSEGEQYFVVRATFTNPHDEARAGMVGRAKITSAGGWFHSGWYPVGYTLLRTPARWLWRTAWSWLP
jgi:RND family efflux transporter MFP subunit